MAETNDPDGDRDESKVITTGIRRHAYRDRFWMDILNL
jgi:hypothetical protein